jgi:hypothetical protein
MNSRIIPLLCVAPLVLFVGFAGSVSAAAAELRIGQATVLPGAVVSVPGTIAGTSGALALQFDVSFDPSMATLTSFSAGSALRGQIMDQQQLAPGLWRALVYSPTNGPLTPGTVVWLNFKVPTNAPDGVVPLLMTNAVVALAAGQAAQPLAQVAGALTVSSTENLTTVALAGGGQAGGGQLRTTIVGFPGRVLTLQGTPDFFHWANLGSYTNQSGVLVITNGLPAGRSAYFYRTVFSPVTNRPAVTAPSLTGAKLLADGKMRFQLNSTAASTWRVEGSPDLFHWGNYGVVTDLSGSLPVTNTPVGKPGVYFFRVVQP